MNAVEAGQEATSYRIRIIASFAGEVLGGGCCFSVAICVCLSVFPLEKIMCVHGRTTC